MIDVAGPARATAERHFGGPPCLPRADAWADARHVPDASQPSFAAMAVRNRVDLAREGSPGLRGAIDARPTNDEESHGACRAPRVASAGFMGITGMSACTPRSSTRRRTCTTARSRRRPGRCTSRRRAPSTLNRRSASSDNRASRNDPRTSAMLRLCRRTRRPCCRRRFCTNSSRPWGCKRRRGPAWSTGTAAARCRGSLRATTCPRRNTRRLGDVDLHLDGDRRVRVDTRRSEARLDGGDERGAIRTAGRRVVLELDAPWLAEQRGMQREREAQRHRASGWHGFPLVTSTAAVADA